MSGISPVSKNASNCGSSSITTPCILAAVTLVGPALYPQQRICRFLVTELLTINPLAKAHSVSLSLSIFLNPVKQISKVSFGRGDDGVIRSV